MLGDPTGAGRRVCGAYGRGAGTLPSALQSTHTPGLYGRATCPAHQRDQAASPRWPRAAGEGRLRVGTAWDGAHLHGHGASQWHAACQGDRAQDRRDWTNEIRDLREVRYPEAARVRLVCENLKTHGIGSLYEAFPPEKARELIKRLEMHPTPTHGSWLNSAEMALSALTSQCLDRRIPDIGTLRKEARAWEKRRNACHKGVDWQFTTRNVRIQLKRLYPQIQE